MTAATTPVVPAVERELATDLARRGLYALPVLVLIGFVGWRVDGALSAAFGVGIVLVNLALSAAMLGWAAPRGGTVLMGAALGGFLLRMLLVLVALMLVKGQPWAEMVPLGLTVVVTHLGLLVWESRHVSATLAYPGLKPHRGA